MRPSRPRWPGWSSRAWNGRTTSAFTMSRPVDTAAATGRADRARSRRLIGVANSRVPRAYAPASFRPQGRRHGETEVPLPAIAERDLVDRFPCPDPPLPGGVAHRNDPVQMPAGILRHLEDVTHLVRKVTLQHPGQSRDDPFGAGGQHRAPKRRIDPAALFGAAESDQQ